MAKQSKTKAVKRKKSTKYSKLLVVASKELAVRTKSLIQAERNLAKAKQKHEELISEVARLDMVKRSLTAMVEGTEPPTNIKYVYQYPPWVWSPYVQQPYVTYYTTLPTPVTYTSPQWTSGNISLGTINANNAIGGLANNAIGGLTNGTGTFLSSSVPTMTTTCSSVAEPMIIDATVSGTLNSSLAMFTNHTGDAGLVVDLTTHAEPTDASAQQPEAVAAIEDES